MDGYKDFFKEHVYKPIKVDKIKITQKYNVQVILLYLVLGIKNEHFFWLLFEF